MRRLIGALILVMVMAIPAYAGNGGFKGGTTAAGGFQGPGAAAAAETVKEALALPDDARVVLTGNIVSKLAGDDDEYLFKDATGEIRVEIDRKVFAGRTITPETTIRLYGKVDKEIFEKTKVDVKQFEIVK